MRKSQLDRVIEEMQAKRLALIDKFQAELNGLDAAIAALKTQTQRKPRAVKPRAVDAQSA
jgi:hypothetical protein